jgi:uncharacterized cupin superfamily protein
METSAGLTRTGLNLLTLPPGGGSFTYHAHHREEEWIYILSGRAVLDAGDAQHELGGLRRVPSAAATASAAQHLDCRRPLSRRWRTRGDRLTEFPKLKKRIIRVANQVAVYDLDDTQLPPPFPGIEPL